VAQPPREDLTPTVRAVAEQLGEGPVTAQQLVTAILTRHRSDYANGLTDTMPVDWPSAARELTPHAWLEEARAAFTTEAHGPLHGRIVILGAALADPPAGRALTRAGVFHGVAAELQPRLAEGLTLEGLRRLSTIPLAAAGQGLGMRDAGLAGGVDALAYSPGGQLLAAGGPEGWRVLTRDRLAPLLPEPLPGPVARLAFVDGDRVAVAGGDRLAVWRARSGTEPEAELLGGVVLALEHGLAVGADGTTIRLPGQLRGWPGSTDAYVAGTIAAHGRVVALATRSGRLVLVDVTDDGWSVRARMGTAEGSTVAALALDPEGARVLAAGDGGDLEARDTGSGASLWEEVQPPPVSVAAFSPDGSRAVTAGAFAVLRDAASGQLVAELSHEQAIAAAAFSPDGSLVATAGTDGTACLWNGRTGAAVGRLSHAAPVTALAWAPDGGHLATGTAAGVVAVWPTGLEPRLRHRLAAYSADDVRAADDLAVPLEIDADVDALAALVAARTVTPPLSLGLFGDWGSGKSFFMRRLRGRVAQLAADARDSGELQRDVAFHKRIAQVEFNAWHYAESNLWASLVEHILANLRASPDEPDDRVQARKARVLEQIAQQQTAVTAAQRQEEASAGALESSRARLDELDGELKRIAAQDPLAGRGVPDAAKAALSALSAEMTLPSAPGGTVAEVARAVTETRRALEHGRDVLVPLLRARDRRRRFVLLVAVVAGAPAVALAAGLLVPETVRSLTAWATGAMAFLGGAAAWVRGQAQWTSRQLERVDAAADELEAPLREARAGQEAELARVRAEHAEAARVAAQERARLDGLHTALAAATPARMLSELVSERVDSDDYRRHLGVLALVRRDFEAISDYLRLQTQETEACERLADEERDDAVWLGRIVLYIDDLDRCEPAQVVAVLQAVHLLLAFPLFVVVVGVDVRWVERSLALSHPTLLEPDGKGASPRDYLEKIFQIPFWLEPLDAEASRGMLQSLLGPEVARARGAVAEPVRERSNGSGVAQPDADGDGGAAAGRLTAAPSPPTGAEAPAPPRPTCSRRACW
jgi:hypothetical protein